MESETNKRGADFPDPPRSKKRAKYTLVACNECKRRKLKCSGGPVCARCERDNAQCVYITNNVHSTDNNTPTPMSPEGTFRDEGLSTRLGIVPHQIETLQREVRAMAARIQQLESRSPAVNNHASVIPTSASIVSSSSANAGLHRIMNRPQSPTYVGPTSAEFGLSARQRPSDDSDGDDLVSTAAPSPAPIPELAVTTSDPLRELGLTEALRLLTVYENTVGLMYPCVDLDSVRAYITDFFRSEDSAMPTTPGTFDQDWFFARDVEVLKILLATALLAESHGRSERAALLADSVEDMFAGRLKIAEVDMKELLILTLLSIFHSYRDDEVISWRLIGIGFRGAMQLGLHCQDTWLKTGGVFPGELQCEWANRLFWCMYVLDRRFSFGTGLPFSIQDSDMDTDLPEPGTSTPYLTCMISYARLSAKIWTLVVGWRSRPRSTTSDYCSYLDFQVQQWIQSIPSDLRFDPARRSVSGSNPQTDSMMMLQVLLALQANQLRILVYRQNLLSNESIESNVSGASIAVETAKSTVHMLDFFSRVSDIYFQRPEPFNYFLLSALAALFLAVIHAPSRFSQVCRPEFYTAVDMVRRSSTRARTSRRLRKVIRSLKMIWNKSPLIQDQHQQKPSQSHRHHPTQDHTPLSSITSQSHSASLWSISSPPTTALGDNSCEDLTSFFEMAGGVYFDPRSGVSGDEGLFAAESASDGFGAFQADDEALTRVMAGLL